MRTFLRWIRKALARIFGEKVYLPPPRSSRDEPLNVTPELEAARLLMLAAARVDLPAICVRNIGEALIELSQTLPNPAYDDTLWGRPGE